MDSIHNAHNEKGRLATAFKYAALHLNTASLMAV
jgi:hypothetical protein